MKKRIEFPLFVMILFAISMPILGDWEITNPVKDSQYFNDVTIVATGTAPSGKWVLVKLVAGTTIGGENLQESDGSWSHNFQPPMSGWFLGDWECRLFEQHVQTVKDTVNYKIIAQPPGDPE